MKGKKALRLIGVILAAALIFQTAILAYNGIFGGQNGGDIDTGHIIISDEIQNIIRGQDPGGFDRNLNNYKRMLVILDVHDSHKEEIERLLTSGMDLKEILIAYEFLNEAYGRKDELEKLVAGKDLGRTWLEVFTAYDAANPEFTPRNFDFDSLDKLMKSGDIISDDVMIADRVSHQSGKAFEEIIALKKTGEAWKNINASLGILNSQNTIPSVPVTQEQIKKYTSNGALSEDRVVETLVTAFKLGLDEEAAIADARNGYTRERFYAEALELKYR